MRTRAGGKITTTAAGLLLLLAAAAPAARAAVLANSGNFEVFAGTTFPGPELLDEDLLFGIRLGFNASSRTSLELLLAFQETDSSLAGPELAGAPGALEYKALVLDLSFARHLLPRKRATPLLLAGAGWVDVTTDREPEPTPGADLDGLEEDSISVHAAAGVRVALTKGTYLRAEWRARWLQARGHDPLDSEITVGFGYYF